MRLPTGKNCLVHPKVNNMITWITVWVLTITQQPTMSIETETKHQYTYATQNICEKQGKNIVKREGGVYTCNFQQTPIHQNKER